MTKRVATVCALDKVGSWARPVVLQAELDEWDRILAGLPVDPFDDPRWQPEFESQRLRTNEELEAVRVPVVKIRPGWVKEYEAKYGSLASSVRADLERGLAHSAQILEYGRQRSREMALPPEASNTGGTNSQSNKKRKKMNRQNLGQKLHEAPEYRAKAAPWTESDAALFASLPQGGGDVDWATLTGYGHLTSAGVALRDKLKECRGLCVGDDLGERAQRLGVKVLEVVSHSSVTIEFPGIANKVPLRIRCKGKGEGLSYQPIMLECDGMVVKYGRIGDGRDKTAGPCFFIEIPGMCFLRHGGAIAFLRAQQLLEALGVQVTGLRFQRLDCCADLPNADVNEFVHLYQTGAAFARNDIAGQVFVKPGGESTGFVVKSNAVEVGVYEKRVELRDVDNPEKLALMIQNRWGQDVEKAVRVEVRFNARQLKSRRYANFDEMLEGLGELLGWALNSWFRIVCEATDRTHSTRYEYADCWLRTLHAFSWWASILGSRPKPRYCEVAPAASLMKQGIGCIAAALGELGYTPSDFWSVFQLMEEYVPLDVLRAKIRTRAWDAQVRGLELEGGDPRELIGDEDAFKRFRECFGRLDDCDGDGHRLEA